MAALIKEENRLQPLSGQRRPSSADEALFEPEYIQERLGRLERSARNARWGSIRLMIEVLGAIANGSVKDPKRTAAAVINGIDPNTFWRRRPESHSVVPDVNDKREPEASVAREERPAVQAVEGDHNETGLFENARKIIDTITIEKSVLDYLYKNSRWGSSRADWEKRIRFACSIDRILRTDFKGLPLGRLEKFVDRKATTAVFEKLRASSKGTLVLTFHGSFVLIARRLFDKVLENGQIFGRGGTITTTNDPRGALFSALRALQDGRAVLMGPDGPDGRQAATLDVLGTASTAGDGAAFLAYTSNCNTAWYTVVLDGDCFVPKIEAGPSRMPGEKFKEFSNRLYRFYAERIEAAFTGDPGNIVLRPRWSRILNEHHVAGLPSDQKSLR